MKDPVPLNNIQQKRDFDKHEYGEVKLVLWDINPPPEIPNVKAQQQSTIKINIWKDSIQLEI